MAVLDGQDVTRGWTMAWKPRGEAGFSRSADPDLVERVLAVRGVADRQAFLDPSLLHLHDPSALPGLDRAAERLLGAARAGEPICIYGDYDVDGITATAIVYRMLKALVPGARVSTYIPHRIEEGYGLNAAALREIAEGGARVVVSVDCGITATGPADVARDAGLDLIITDHHNLPGDGDPMPDCFALVHPRLPGGAYPFGELCGAGVAYKLAWRLATMDNGSEKVADGVRTLLLDLLSLAALGTVADVVPLVDENRVIVRFGLSRCTTTEITGLTALIDEAGLLGEKIDAEGVGFRLGPMLNASGRMGHAREAVELFITEDRRRAAEIARGLVALNEERRETQRAIYEQACVMADEAGMTGDGARAIVLAHEDWHPGVVGIVCSRLVETYARPAILMQRRPGRDGERCAFACTGSGRSIDGFDLHGAVGACAETFIQQAGDGTGYGGFGGHDVAIGLRMDAGCFDAFAEAFVARANAALSPDDLVRTARYDCDATLGELTPACVKRLDRLAPFGRSNPGVRLRLLGVRVDGRVEPFGKTGAHLGVRLRGTGADSGVYVRTVAWKWAEHLARFHSGQVLDVLVEPKVSSWSGRVEPVLVDARESEVG